MIFNKIKFQFFLLLITGCGTQQSVESVSFEGYRYKVRLAKLATESSWVEIQGTREFFIFNIGVFKEATVDYYEPQFFGSSQACSVISNGDFKVYTNEEIESDKTAENGSVDKSILSKLPDGATYYNFNYEPVKEFKGLCNFSSRIFSVYLQPSGAVDIIDNKKAFRLERLEKI